MKNKQCGSWLNGDKLWENILSTSAADIDGESLKVSVGDFQFIQIYSLTGFRQLVLDGSILITYHHQVISSSTLLTHLKTTGKSLFLNMQLLQMTTVDGILINIVTTGTYGSSRLYASSRSQMYQGRASTHDRSVLLRSSFHSPEIWTSESSSILQLFTSDAYG